MTPVYLCDNCKYLLFDNCMILGAYCTKLKPHHGLLTGSAMVKDKDIYTQVTFASKDCPYVIKKHRIDKLNKLK